LEFAMSKWLSIVLMSLGLSLMLTAAAKAAVPVIDFGPEQGWMIVKGQERGAQFAADAKADADHPRGRVAWTAQHAPFVELHLTTPVPLAPLRDKVDAAVRLELPAPPPPGVTAVSLRLRDSQGQVFQWSRPLAAGPRSKSITFELNPDNSTGHWNTRGEATGVMRPPMELVGFAFSIAQNQQPGAIDLSRLVYARADLPLAELVKVKVVADDALHVLTLDSDPAPTLAITNRGERKLALDLQVTLESFSGQKHTFTQALDLPAATMKPWRLPMQLQRGIWWIDYAVQERGQPQSSLTGSTSLVRMQPTGPAPTPAPGSAPASAPGGGETGEFLFGLNAHCAWYTEPEQVLEARAAGLIGARIVRTGVDWDGVQPRPDQWDWTVMDRLVSLFAEQGIELQYTFAYTPKWASTAPPDEQSYRIWSRMPPRLDAWGDYVQTIVSRYRGKIRFWEVWNEPDLDFFRGSADDYLAMSAIAYERTKRANPQAVVLSAGFSSRPDGADFIEKVLARGGAHIDALAWHQHGTFEDMRHILEDRVAKLRQRHLPGKPWIMNECGLAVPDSGRASQRRQAQALVKKMTYLWSRGALGHMWYQLRDDTRFVVASERPFGLLMGDFSPKAPFAAYNTLTGLLAGKRFAGELDLGPTATALEFADDNARVLVMFTARAHELRVLQTDAREAHAVDLMGNPTPLSINQGRLLVNVTPTPGYVQLIGAARPLVVGPQVLRVVSGNVFPGQSRDVRLEVANPFAGEQDVALELQCGDAVAKTVARLGAGQTQTVSLSVQAPPSAADVRQVPATLSYRFANGSAGTMSIPLDVAMPVMNAINDRPPDFVLDDPQRVVNLFNDDPYQAHKRWQGPPDLSAQTWVAVNDQALGIRVQVMDDAHEQPGDSAGLWQADSVQIGLRLAGQSGFWELTLARGNDGRHFVQITQRPTGTADIAAQIALNTTPRADGVTYDLTIPRAALGLTHASLASGFGFSMLVNDNDRQGREGWIELTSGIGSGKDPTQFLTLVPR
jgi:hypothetical protein